MTDAIGWAASCVLVVTLVHQVHKQWKDRSSEGVSRWLFVGQIAASVGFIVYSLLVKSWVFVVTNSLVLASAVAGAVITVLHGQRSNKRRSLRLKTSKAPAQDTRSPVPAVGRRA